MNLATIPSCIIYIVYGWKTHFHLLWNSSWLVRKGLLLILCLISHDAPCHQFCLFSSAHTVNTRFLVRKLRDQSFGASNSVHAPNHELCPRQPYPWSTIPWSIIFCSTMPWSTMPPVMPAVTQVQQEWLAMTSAQGTRNKQDYATHDWPLCSTQFHLTDWQSKILRAWGDVQGINANTTVTSSILGLKSCFTVSWPDLCSTVTVAV